MLALTAHELPASGGDGGQFPRTEERNHIRGDPKSYLGWNTPRSDEAVVDVDLVVLVQTPEDIVVASPVGDAKWLVMREPDETPGEIR